MNIRQLMWHPAGGEKPSDRALYPRIFAAANGYGGFLCDFDRLFASHDYARLFVLKGGPGTGKSTLMRRIADFGAQQGYAVCCVLCSSDPASLDGVILERGERRCAVLDGTAPHMRDASVPGAIDTLTDLGILWDEGVLRSHRSLILRHMEAKQRYYREAYDSLALSGDFDSKIEAEINTAFTPPVFTPVTPLPDAWRGEQARIRISAFGREGYLRLDTLTRIARRRYTVMGKYGSEYLWLAALSQHLHARGIGALLAISPLTPDRIEAVYLPHDGTLISVADSDAERIDSTLLLDAAQLADSDGMLSRYAEYRDRFLIVAQEALAHASEEHLALERIYGSAMDFTPMAGILADMTEKIRQAMA